MPIGDPWDRFFLSHPHTHDRFLYSKAGNGRTYIIYNVVQQFSLLVNSYKITNIDLLVLLSFKNSTEIFT